MKTRLIIEKLGRPVLVRRGAGNYYSRDGYRTVGAWQEFLVDADLSPEQIRRAIHKCCPLLPHGSISCARKIAHRLQWSKEVVSLEEIPHAMRTTIITPLSFKAERFVSMEIVGEYCP